LINKKVLMVTTFYGKLSLSFLNSCLGQLNVIPSVDTPIPSVDTPMSTLGPILDQRLAGQLPSP
jgi:hypothetical protein